MIKKIAPIIFLLLISCAGEIETSDSSFLVTEATSSIAVAIIGGLANGTERYGTMTYFQQPETKSPLDYVIPKAVAHAGHCHEILDTVCDGNVRTRVYEGCKFTASQAVWSGSQSMTFNSPENCEAYRNEVISSGTAIRAFEPGTTRMSPTGILVEVDTGASLSGWSENVAGGGSLIAFGSGGSRTIEVTGVKLTATVAGEEVGSYTISSGQNIVITGVRQDRRVIAGSVRVQNNLSEYTAVTSVIDPLEFSYACCVPTSGRVRTIYSGSKQGMDEMSFSEECGYGILDDGGRVRIDGCF